VILSEMGEMQNNFYRMMSKFNSIKNYTLLVLILFSASLNAQLEDNTSILRGMAPDHAGQKIYLYKYKDNITFTKELVDSVTVKNDSTFSMTINIDYTFEGLLEVGNKVGVIYINPRSEYNVLYPYIPREQTKRIYGNEVQLYFEEMERTDVNYLIIDFSYRVDDFMRNNFIYFNSPIFRQNLDTFKLDLKEIYEGTTSKYFKNYMRYNVASMEQMGEVGRGYGDKVNARVGDLMMNTLYLYNEYISNKPVLYHNKEYMRFFNEFYKGTFSQGSSTDQLKLKEAILYENYDDAMSVLEKAAYLKNERIRELVFLKSMGEVFHGGSYNQRSIIHLFKYIKENSNYPDNSKIADNFYNYFTELTPSYPAPDFQLIDQHGDTVSLEDFRGKYLYLQFYTSWSRVCQSEMPLIVDLKKKYGKDFSFISVSLDEDLSANKRFLKMHRDYNWHFTHFSDDPIVKERYRVQNIPEYFLIDPKGKIHLAPALRPSTDGKKETIDWVMFEINKKLNPRRKFIPGQKTDY